MANMFSGNIEKQTPKNLKDCYQTDAVTRNLWVWCERLEKWGLRLCVLLGIIGIISIISNGIEMANLLNELNIDMDEIRSAAAEYNIEIKSVFEVVVEGIFTWTFYCFIEYCSYHILALLIGSLATIVQNTKISANIAMYNCSKNEDEEALNAELQENNNYSKKTCVTNSNNVSSEQKTTNTTTVNANKVDRSTQNGQYTTTENNTIICSVCDYEQPANRRVCWHCGAKFEKDNNGASHKWLCDGCKKMRMQSPCEHCGKE